jgi:hypothetical protein
MPITSDTLGRITKLFVDRDKEFPELVRERLSRYRVALVCGPEVASSPSLQAAVLTAMNVANRCFPGAVSFHPPTTHPTPRLLIPWSGAVALPHAVAEIAGPLAVGRPEVPKDAPAQLIFGSRAECEQGLQVTFDGWVAAVAPVTEALRLPETDTCVLAGIVAGALGVSEIFLDFARVTIEASRRSVGLSLWRPDLDWKDPNAKGPCIEFLPAEIWALGLGHLGQAFLWALCFLPYRDPAAVNILLNDYDRIVPANCDTGLLTFPEDVGLLKTRVANRWLEQRGFRPRLSERRFDAGTRCYKDEPKLALCGFDDGGPRGLLDTVGFEHVIECGLGGKAANFDVMSLHTLPHPARRAREIWPSSHESQDQKRQRELEKFACANPVYRAIAAEQGCGHVELAGRAVAVPFVGATAAGLVLAEAIRMLHDGERYAEVNLRLETPKAINARRVLGGYYERNSRVQVKYQPVDLPK